MSILGEILRSNSVTRQVTFNTTKIAAKCQNWNTTICVIFKQFACQNRLENVENVVKWDFFKGFSSTVLAYILVAMTPKIEYKTGRSILQKKCICQVFECVCGPSHSILTKIAVFVRDLEKHVWHLFSLPFYIQQQRSI